MIQAAALVVAMPFAIAQGASISTTTLQRFEQGTPIVGSKSTLLREPSGLSVTISTSDLEPGAAYTLWWVIFNHPEECTPPACGDKDLPPFGGGPAVNGSAVIATGHIISSSGKADFGAFLAPGDTTGAVFGPGLVNVNGAEIRLVVRSHGQPISGMVEEQINSFEGGCGVNTCFDDQIVIHPPVADEGADALAGVQQELMEIENLLRRIAGRLSLNP
jgi:hypothetical protein